MTDDDTPDPFVDESPVTAEYTSSDGEIEASLRPKNLDDFIGQPRVREQLQLVLRGARCAAVRPTTSFCPARPDWGRPRWQ